MLRKITAEDVLQVTAGHNYVAFLLKVLFHSGVVGQVFDSVTGIRNLRSVRIRISSVRLLISEDFLRAYNLAHTIATSIFTFLGSSSRSSSL